jgi:hypothetical protein
MSDVGPTRKNSQRAYVFRCSPNNGRRTVQHTSNRAASRPDRCWRPLLFSPILKIGLYPTPTPWINALGIEPGIARPRLLASGQDVAHVARIPAATTRCCHASVVEHVGDLLQRGRSCLLLIAPRGYCHEDRPSGHWPAVCCCWAFLLRTRNRIAHMASQCCNGRLRRGHPSRGFRPCLVRMAVSGRARLASLPDGLFHASGRAGLQTTKARNVPAQKEK